MSSASIQGLLTSKYESYHICQDGEGDDIQAMIIAKTYLGDTDIQVDCVIGNPDIVHVSSGDKSLEMQARMQLANQIFGRTVALHGAESNSDVSKKYVDGILEQSSVKKCLVLHTSSFKSLQELFQKAAPGQLRNVVILSYGSVNLTWAIPRNENGEKSEEEYRKFYQALTQSGAKLVQAEAFPFLGKRNQVTVENTSVTHSLLSQMDGPVGKRWHEVTENSTAKTRTKQAEKVVKGIVELLKSSPAATEDLLKKTPQLEGLQTIPHDYETLLTLLNRSLTADQHKRFASVTRKLEALLPADLKRSLSIFTSTSLVGQALIADQIPAIIFSELVEGRQNGLLKECLSVEFDGFNEINYPKFAVKTADTALYYLNTKAKAVEGTEEKYIEAYLKYIDLCIATSLLVHKDVFSKATQQSLVESLQETLSALADDVQSLGYDLPKSYHDLMLVQV
jgi:hypothetical protein